MHDRPALAQSSFLAYTRLRHFLAPTTTLTMVLLLILSLPGVGWADLIFFRDGFVLQGKVRRESVTEWDPVGRDLLVIPRGFFMVDDGARRFYFSPSQPRVVEKKAPPPEERIYHRSKKAFIVRRNLPPILEVLETSRWTNTWERNFRYQSDDRQWTVPQHMSILTPSHARIDATAKFYWSCFYLTSELGPDRVKQLIEVHPDFQFEKKLKPVEHLARRLRLTDFYAQAGWYSLAEEQLDTLLKEQPSEKKRIEQSRASLHRMSTRDEFEHIKRLFLSGQYVNVRGRLARMSTSHASDEMKAELRELESRLKDLDKEIDQADRFLTQLAKEVDGPQAAILARAAGTIRTELHPATIDRLEVFLGFARQAQRTRNKGQNSMEPDELLSLAVSGWLLRSPSAQTDPGFAASLWQARELVLKYLNTDNAGDRANLLRAYERETGKLRPAFDEIMHMIPLLPPADPERVPAGKAVERQATGDRFGNVKYHLQLPPEYNRLRKYPVLIVLHREGQKPETMLERWQKVAADNGYILVAPKWEFGLGRKYSYSEREHDVVLQTLLDLRKHFQVDSDRVFLFGFGEGGVMAFDVGLAYPGLFAGVLPMGAVPDLFSAACWRNGQYLPFYAMFGTRVGELKKQIHNQFDHWLKRGYPMLWVEYKGRGVDWYGGELPSMMDWMRHKRRAFPLRKLGTDGLGGTFGNEFCIMRQGPRRFYWLSADEVSIRNVNSASNWRRYARAATLTARIDRRSNTVNIKTSGLEKVTLWLGADRQGKQMIDFDRKLTIRIGLRQYPPFRVQPKLSTLLEDLYQWHDRQRLFLAKVVIPLRRRR